MRRIQLIGNIGQDASVREVNGLNVINFSVAVSEKYTDGNGIKHEKTNWFNCSIWKNKQQSTEVAKYILRGGKIFVEGTPDVELWKDRDNNQRFKINVRVTELKLLGSPEQKSNIQDDEYAPSSNNSDDIPF